jgi:RNA polymerase primary sigma factor
MRQIVIQDLEESIAISEERAVFGELISQLLREQLEQILETLSEREGEIIKMRFGFYDEPMTFQEISQYFGISRERVRQIEAKTMKKLRHPSRTQAIRDYLDD